MGRVLLFNLTEESRRKKVKAALFRCGLSGQEVRPEEQGRTLGALLGSESGSTAEETPEATPEKLFPEEMIVMHGLSPRQFHGFLESLKAQGIRIPLKAVTTEHNLRWTAETLRRELLAEHAAMAKGAGESVHAGSREKKEAGGSDG